VRFELRNVVANYPFESSRGFPGSEPNCGHGDHSRLSCSAGIRSSGLGSAGVFSNGGLDRESLRFLHVKIGLRHEGYRQILEGLQAGDLVATDGAIFLSNMLKMARTQ